MAKLSNSTERLRPVVPSAVLPKQAWHSEPATLQQQYETPSVTACISARWI